jgi:hypothetical protein
MGLSIDQIADGLRATGGFISQAAKKLNVTQGAISKRIGQSVKLQKIRKEIDESYLDLTESKLIKKINSDNLGAICFYLKCKGKERGYIEQVDNNIKFGDKPGKGVSISVKVGK